MVESKQREGIKAVADGVDRPYPHAGTALTLALIKAMATPCLAHQRQPMWAPKSHGMHPPTLWIQRTKINQMVDSGRWI